MDIQERLNQIQEREISDLQRESELIRLRYQQDVPQALRALEKFMDIPQDDILLFAQHATAHYADVTTSHVIDILYSFFLAKRRKEEEKQ